VELRLRSGVFTLAAELGRRDYFCRLGGAPGRDRSL
jgi:hypothetical protein